MRGIPTFESRLKFESRSNFPFETFENLWITFEWLQLLTMIAMKITKISINYDFESHLTTISTFIVTFWLKSKPQQF